MKKDLLIPYIALSAICLIWGTTYLVLRIAVLHFPPFLFVTIRQLIAGSLLIAFMLLSGKAAWPDRAHLVRQAVAGFFMISLGNGLVAWAEVVIPSGVAAIICSLMPMVVILINLGVNKDERPTVAIVTGVLLGLGGIMMIFGEHLVEFAKIEYQLGILVIFIAVLSWAGGSVWLKRRGNDGNAFLNAGLQMFFGGIWLIPGALIFDDLDQRYLVGRSILFNDLFSADRIHSSICLLFLCIAKITNDDCIALRVCKPDRRRHLRMDRAK